jgi:uncharacterized phage protein (TIGR02218 family)
MMRKIVGSDTIFTDPYVFTEQIGLADLWTITTITGTVLRWTSLDIPITTGGYTYSCGPIMKRGNTRITSSPEVDTLSVTIETGDSITLGGIPFSHAAANGALDGASVKLERAFMKTWGEVNAVVHLFEGRVSGIDPKHTEVAIEIKSLLETLNSKWPRNLYQPACNHQLYGAGCKVIRENYQVTGTATGGTTTRINWNPNKDAEYYDQGVIVFTSGQNVGARRTIKTQDSTGLTVALPLQHAVKSGDRFTVVPGCDKTHDTCRGKFQNLTRYRGFPWVPKPEMVR